MGTHRERCHRCVRIKECVYQQGEANCGYLTDRSGYSRLERLSASSEQRALGPLAAVLSFESRSLLVDNRIEVISSATVQKGLVVQLRWHVRDIFRLQDNDVERVK